MQIKKTISQIALGLVVIGLGATTSAFTNNQHNIRLDEENPLWSYNGSGSPTTDNPKDGQQYSQSEDPESCSGESTVCQISAPTDPESSETDPKPDMDAEVPNITPTQTVADRIQEALDNHQTNETVLDFKNL